MTRVKICGLTNLEDALAAATAGAHYLGFILWHGSPRAIQPTAAAAICQHLRQQHPRPLLVGVFVNASGAEMATIMAECGFDLAQLHGEEVPALIGDPTSPLYGRAYKALRPTSLAEAEAEAEWYLPPARQPDHPALLLDTYHPQLRGGTGQAGDWRAAAHLAAQIPGLMLAGGLTPANVTAAVRQVRPFAVDVAGGVEQSPGVKDHRAVRAFIHAAQAAL
ncbi:MAG: phosphoribosylanthranilate isomerase [Candidatus Promineifilaceae bacterium]